MGRAGFPVWLLVVSFLCVSKVHAGGYEGEVRPGVPTGAGFACSVGGIRLDEVVRRSGSSEVFVQQWSGLIDRIAECVNQASMRNTCVSVQGQYAPLLFEWGDQAAGGPAGTQNAVSEARALAVRTRLRAHHVDEHRISMLPVPERGTYEGVQIRIARDCSEAATGGQTVAGGPTLELGGAGSALFLGPSDVQSGLVRIGAGYRGKLLYTRVEAGLMLGSTTTQRGAFEVGGAVGVDFHVLQFGAVGIFRQGANGLFAGWLERVWSLGLEARQCKHLGKTLWDLCLREAFFPVGSQTLRGKIVQGDVYRVPQRSDSVMRFDLGLNFAREF